MSEPTTNRLGLTKQDYVGSRSTLCPGCGHDAITAQIIQATWELGLEAHKVVKLSGIGCSSKTPAYFLSGAWGFNGVHGRAAPVATGVALANRHLTHLLISGDGDSMSIGMGHFVHLIRHNIPLVYIIENNGVYGLTKGQFSATADEGSTLKQGTVNDLKPIDPAILAMELGCGFVARSFSGNPRQLVTILKAAFSHAGTAVIDIISPCVSFNNHEGSTKSYKSLKDRETPLQELGFVPAYEASNVDIPPGESRDVEFPDGSHLIFRTLRNDFDPSDRFGALRAMEEARANGEFLTGILHLQPSRSTLAEWMNLIDAPLALLPESMLKPGPELLQSCMETFM